MSHLVLVLGPPGSGRSTVLAALTGRGFAVSDTTGTASTALLGGGGPVPPRIALVVDLDLEGQIADLPGAVAAARDAGHRVDVILLDADEQVLIARAQTPPALAEYGLGPITLGQARARLRPLRDLADLTVDTSTLAAQDLGAMVLRQITAGPAALG